ncbi:TPA: 4Fe-4S binding protein, partial [Thermoplasmata archaeon]|nr:4Fe-4S binding protein [Thermoplasmata archaeon]
KEKFVGSKTASMDEGLCTSCRRCEEFCRFSAIHVPDQDGAKPTIDIDVCEGCGVCVRICPEKAVRLVDRTVGEWYLSETDRGTMVHALLEPGAENSGKLVAMVKHMAKAAAKEQGAELVLVDGPPGIGCPVISALSGADLVVIVSEPTLSGLSDFKRIADLARGFHIVCALLVNKSDLNCDVTDSLLKEAGSRDIECIGNIPYDEVLIERMAKGVDFADDGTGSAAVDEISKSYRRLRWLL